MLGITSPVAAKEGLLSVVVSNLILEKDSVTTACFSRCTICE
jgi:hypothetical protein